MGENKKLFKLKCTYDKEYIEARMAELSVELREKC